MGERKVAVGVARPRETYRGSRPQDLRPRRAAMLKAARIRRGITRRELDAEREALRRWLTSNGEYIARGFTAGRLHAIAQEMAKDL